MSPFSLTPDELHALRTSPQRQSLSPMAAVRLDCILHFLEHGQSIAQTCEVFHISRGTLQRWLDRFDPTDLQTLEERSNMPARGTAVPETVVSLIRGYRTESPLLGKEVIATRLQTQHGIIVSPSTVGRVIEAECLYFGDTPLHWRKRMYHRQTHGTEPTPAAGKPPQATRIPVTCERDACTKDSGCILCTVRRKWPDVRKTLVIVSIVSNVFFFGAMLAIGWYQSHTTNQPTVQAVLAPSPSRHK